MNRKTWVAVVGFAAGIVAAVAANIITLWYQEYRALQQVAMSVKNSAQVLMNTTQGGAEAATWLSQNCSSKPADVYATVVNGDTFWMWCKPAATDRGLFIYATPAVPHVAGLADPLPIRQELDIPIGMGGPGNELFLYFRRVDS